jgi:hypothetical protein
MLSRVLVLLRARLCPQYAAIVPHGPRAAQGAGPVDAAATGAASSSGQGAGASAAPGTAVGSSGGGGFSETRFLALDKCLPGREFLQARASPAPPFAALHRTAGLDMLTQARRHDCVWAGAPWPGAGRLWSSRGLSPRARGRRSCATTRSGWRCCGPRTA